MLDGKVEEGNSSSETLLGGISFIGDGAETLDYALIFVTVYSDVASATDGCCLQTSSDGITWRTSECYTIDAGVEKTFTIQPNKRFFRVVYTNGVATQSLFDLQTVFKKGNSVPSSHRISDDISPEDDATLQKSVLTGQRPDGVFTNINDQNPISVDFDSVYLTDLNFDSSNNYNFSGKVEDYFSSLTSVNTDSTSNNPKQIKVWFNRTVYASAIAFGCNDLLQNFSNIKLTLLGSGEVERLIVDLTSDNTKYNSLDVKFTPSLFNAIMIEFHTADPVSLSNITMRKELKVNSQIEALQSDGTAIQLTATDNGNLKVANVEDGLAIAKGEVAGSTFIHKFGDAPDFDPGDGFVSIWDGADDGDIAQMQYVYSTTDDIDSISSSDNGDTQQVEIQGLDINYELVIQTITLTGQARKALDTNLIRVFRMKTVDTTDNAGHVYCYVNTAIVAGVPVDTTQVRAVIQPLENQTLMAIYTIPAGKTGYARDWYSSASGLRKTPLNQIKLYARPFGQVFQLKHKAAISLTGSSYIKHLYSEPEVFAEKTDIEMRANTDEVESGVSAGFDIVLVDN